MHSVLNQRLTTTYPHDSEGLKHQILDLNKADDLKIFENIISDINVIVIDQIESQLRDLIKLSNPNLKLDEEGYNSRIQDVLQNSNRNLLGLWVFYPWKKTIVHILAEEDFVKVRTIRNQYKITPEQQITLRNSIVGVIGLSVGQSVSMVLALERIAGEIRIADFDTLELSNMNRIRSSVANLGLKKSTIVYREIAEMDPFIKVTAFHEGITKANIDSFLLDGGKLNLLVEECDGVEIKVLARERCKKLGIPVIMDMSDRGMFDIERFDLDPNYPTLHGLLNEELTYEFLASLKTSEDKLPYMLPMVGIDTLSPKMKASILEVASSITTWPQLGSDVIMGGAVSANVARRILLGDRLKSGRSWVDIDKLFQVEGENQVTINTEVDSDIYSSEYNSANSILSDDEIASLLKAASLAPSPGNLQRWMWSFRNDEIHLTNTHHSNVKLGDHGNVGSNLSYGAALENLILTAKSLGYDFQLKLFPSEIAEVVAVVKLNKANVQADDLSAYIHTRQTHRLDGEEEFDLDKLDQLRDLIARSNSEELFIQLLDQETDVSKIASLIGRGDRLRLMNELGYREFFKEEIRWNKEEAETIGDGLDISLFDFTPSDLIGLKLANDESAMAFLREIGGGKGFEKISPKSFKKHHKIIVFSVRDYSNSAIVKAGMQIQRFWLNCSGLQLGIHPYTVMQMLFSHLYIGSDILSKSEKKELQAIHDSFHDVIGMNPNEYKSVFLAKVICNPAPQRRSYRKPINKIFK